jgi:tRNA-splicing ligase RtcB
MKAKELLNIGYKEGPVIGIALKATQNAKAHGMHAQEIRDIVRYILSDPSTYLNHPQLGIIAQYLESQKRPAYDFSDKEFSIFGKELVDENTLEQMKNCMRLPISVAGATMPDAHVGYGLPIGGVLATDNSIIPFAVGVDIACRMMLTVLPMPASDIGKYRDDFHKLIGKHTRFGLGASYENKLEHEVMDDDWSFSPIVKQVKDLAWEQLGTQGGGNHFCDVGEIDLAGNKYIAIITHSGSRGPGNKIATYYSDLAKSLRPFLPNEYKHLAWLDMDSDEGVEYWRAMHLMGRYASASHHLTHEGFLSGLKVEPLLQVENHHNFCWKEIVNGRELYVHRKGATPAQSGVLGIIPGSMATPGFLVKGKGNLLSLNSASHGAGRAKSRKATKESTRWSHVRAMLKERGVELLGAGLDEAPTGYKPIRDVMNAQKDLVEIIAEFTPRIVMMAEDGSSED